MRRDTIKERSIAEEVPRWKTKIDLEKAATEIGRSALDEDLRRTHDGLSIANLSEIVDTILNEKRQMSWGHIHGDLHAANVNLDETLNVYLIDFRDTRFGWRALDFVILEAAIKFAASPNHAPVSALLQCEKDIDSCDGQDLGSASLLYGNELTKIVSAASSIRANCKTCGAELSIENYRSALICVAASFTSIEWLVNRRFLFHSIAYQWKQMQGRSSSS